MHTRRVIQCPHLQWLLHCTQNYYILDEHCNNNDSQNADNAQFTFIQSYSQKMYIKISLIVMYLYEKINEMAQELYF